MMGGAGGAKACHYAKKIGQMDLSAQLIVVMGKNEKMRKDLEKIALHPSNSLLLLGFTDRSCRSDGHFAPDRHQTRTWDHQ